MKIAPSTGPMHGVQPTATNAPSASERADRAAGRCDGSRPTLSRSSTGPKTPVVSTPSAITAMPASLAHLRDPEERAAEEADRRAEHHEHGAEAADEQERLGQDGRASGGHGATGPVGASVAAASPRKAR